MIKGIILAGDSGTSLHPLTLGIPKQLLPIYDKPMVYYPIYTMVSAGIKDILIITTTENQPLFKKTLGDGTQFGASFTYAIQDEPRGIAEALTIANDFIEKDGVCLMTGDTLITGDTSYLITKAAKAVKSSGSATIFVKRDPDENQYGKVIIDNTGKCTTIVGSSDTFFYNSIVGLYVFPKDAVQKAATLPISERGRYEITDLNNLYFKEKKLQILTLSNECEWLDTNTYNNLIKASLFIQKNH